MAHYTRNFDLILPKLKQVNDQIITLEDCRIQLPERFSTRGLASVSSDVFIFGIYALIMGDFYCTCNVNAMMRITPSKILTTKVNNDNYLEFHFDKGSVVIANINLVKRDIILFNVVDEIFIKGNVPWYLDYSDLGKLFDSAKEHANSEVGSIPEAIELVASLLARTPEDRSKYYRTSLVTEKDTLTKPPEYIPLNSVFYASTNTMNKLAGNYFTQGVISSLATKTETLERFEALLRT